VVANVEFDENCAETLSKNFGRKVLATSITDIPDPKMYLEALSGLTDVPVLIGGPPCQAFSQAGRQRADADERGQMIYEYVRFLEALKPSYFVMENVANLQGVQGGRIYKEVMETFAALGYTVNVAKLNASDFGSAQKRVRLIFIGSRPGLPMVDMPIATHRENRRGVGDAFAGLPCLEPKLSEAA